MATINSAGSGNYSSGSTWVGGGVPNTSDDYVVLSGHTVTLDTTGLVGRTLTINSGGTLVSSTSTNSVLTLQMGLINNGTLTIDMSTCPQYYSHIVMNASASATSQGATFNAASSYTLKGAPKKSWTYINGAMSSGATSCTVDAADGWRDGDVLILATTSSYNVTPLTDTVTGTSVSGLNISWATGTTNPHADDCPVANMTRNVRIGGATSAVKSFIFHNGSSGTPKKVMDNVEVANCTGGHTSFPSFGLKVSSDSGPLQFIKDCSFLNCIVGGYQVSGNAVGLVNCSFFAAQLGNVQNFVDFYPKDCLFLYGTAHAVQPAVPKSELAAGNLISGYLTAFSADFIQCSVQSTHTWSCARGAIGVYGYWATYLFKECSFGIRFNSLISSVFHSNMYPIDVIASDCDLQTSNLVSTSSYDFTEVSLINKNKDPGVQEIYSRHSSTVPIIQRNVSIVTGSTSSIEMTCNVSLPITLDFKVLAKSGETVKLLCYVRKNILYGAATLPKITVSGLNITPITSTMAAGTVADAWELLTLEAANTSSSDGELTVTFTAQSTTSGAKAFFSGLPAPPFVTRCRHYGYVFDETIPTRTINPLVVDSEETAAAYTGATFTTSTKRITFSAGTIDTYQKLYDYSQAWGCSNISETMPFELAGVSLLLADGWTVVDPPALTGSFGWASGTIEYTTPGTYTTPISGSDVRFTTAGSYHLTGQISGTIELLNTSGGAVTVYLPAGANYTNTGPNITVELPVAALTIAANVSLVGAEIRVYDLDLSDGTYGTELAGVESCTTATFDYVGGAVGNELMVQVMLAGYVEINQKHTIVNITETLNLGLTPDLNA